MLKSASASSTGIFASERGQRLLMLLRRLVATASAPPYDASRCLERGAWSHSQIRDMIRSLPPDFPTCIKVCYHDYATNIQTSVREPSSGTFVSAFLKCVSEHYAITRHRECVIVSEIVCADSTRSAFHHFCNDPRYAGIARVDGESLASERTVHSPKTKAEDAHEVAPQTMPLTADSLSRHQSPRPPSTVIHPDDSVSNVTPRAQSPTKGDDVISVSLTNP